MTEKWIKVDAGEYVSADERFEAYRDYDRIFGNHWVLHDTTVADYYQSRMHYNSLKECKGVAATILRRQEI